MFEITKAATDKLSEYLKDMEYTAIRIFLHAGGCGGPSLVMGLDEPKDTDHVFEVNGYKFLIDKDFMNDAQPIKVDFSELKSSLIVDLSLKTLVQPVQQRVTKDSEC